MFSKLQTYRLELKLISFEDREFIFSQFSNEVVNRYLFDAEPLVDLFGADDIIDFYINSMPVIQCRWILVLKSNNEKIGTCGFHCWDIRNDTVEIGYDLNPDYWHQGYMQEALAEIITYAFSSMQVKQIDACIYTGNERSISLVEKLGFIFQGQMRDEIFRGDIYPHKIYSLTAA